MSKWLFKFRCVSRPKSRSRPCCFSKLKSCGCFANSTQWKSAPKIGVEEKEEKRGGKKERK
jgi:hypothetical protein